MGRFVGAREAPRPATAPLCGRADSAAGVTAFAAALRGGSRLSGGALAARHGEALRGPTVRRAVQGSAELREVLDQELGASLGERAHPPRSTSVEHEHALSAAAAVRRRERLHNWMRSNEHHRKAYSVEDLFVDAMQNRYESLTARRSASRRILDPARVAEDQLKYDAARSRRQGRELAAAAAAAEAAIAAEATTAAVASGGIGDSSVLSSEAAPTAAATAAATTTARTAARTTSQQTTTSPKLVTAPTATRTTLSHGCGSQPSPEQEECLVPAAAGGSALETSAPASSAMNDRVAVEAAKAREDAQVERMFELELELRRCADLIESQEGELERMRVRAESVQHKLWFAEKHTGALSHLVECTRDEGTAWRSRFALIVAGKEHAVRAKGELEKRVLELQRFADGASQVASETRARLRASDAELLRTREALAHESASLAAHRVHAAQERAAHEAERELLALQLAESRAALENEQRAHVKYRAKVSAFVARQLQDEQLFADKSAAVRKYRADNPCRVAELLK